MLLTSPVLACKHWKIRASRYVAMRECGAMLRIVLKVSYAVVRSLRAAQETSIDDRSTQRLI
jgi:hypothetical protein